jgi:hypothetical protein
MRILIGSILAAACVQAAPACDMCALYSASDAQGGGKGLFGGVAEQFTHFGTVQNDGQKLPNTASQYLNGSILQLFAGYNFSDRFGLQFNVPVIHRSFQRPRGSVIETGTVSGLGDVSLIGNFRACQKLLENFTFTWTLLGGIKFPTGDSSRLNEPDVDSEPPLPDSGIGGHDLALGSGSFDGIVGTSLMARWQRAFLTANLQYAIRTEGDFGHQYANDLTWAGGPGYYLVLEDTHTVALQLNVSGEDKGKDTFNGVPDNDSAETIVYLGPQINFTWSSKLSVQVGVDLPVSIYNSGVQVVPDYRARAALIWRF